MTARQVECLLRRPLSSAAELERAAADAAKGAAYLGGLHDLALQLGLRKGALSRAVPRPNPNHHKTSRSLRSRGVGGGGFDRREQDRPTPTLSQALSSEELIFLCFFLSWMIARDLRCGAVTDLKDFFFVSQHRVLLMAQVLPFDDQTSLADQGNLGNRRTHSLEAQRLLAQGALDEATLLGLQRHAVALRQLLRVKISDDADLDQAAAALRELTGFLGGLDRAAAAARQPPFVFLRSLS